MANYGIRQESSNNLEREYQATSMTLKGVIDKGSDLRDSATGLPKGQTVLKIGDLVAIGTVPANCSINGLRILVHEGFAAGTTVKLWVQSDFPDAIGAIPLVNDGVAFSGAGEIVVTRSNTTIIAPINPAGNTDAAAVNVPIVGDGNIWVGNNDGFIIVAELGGTDVSDTAPVGEIEVVLDYAKFGTNNGSYTGVR